MNKNPRIHHGILKRDREKKQGKLFFVECQLVKEEKILRKPFCIPKAITDSGKDQQSKLKPLSGRL